MANDGYSRQGNPFSRGGINSRIIQGNNFSGTVIDSLSSGPDGPDRVWGTPPPVVQGAPAPAPRTRLTGFGTYEVMSPMQRAQEQLNQNDEPPVFITVRRRNTSLNSTTRFEGLSEEERETHLQESRAAFVQEYNTLTDPTLQRLLALCNPLLNIDVNIERKYVELDILRVFEANKEKPQFLHLTQGLGILEKYASNLIKEARPPYWRTVKFTSALVQVHVGSLIGSRDILSQMGYTEDLDDGVSFPANVPEPDVQRLRDLAPDLFFARYEIDAMLTNNHPFYEIEPPVPESEVQLPALLRTTFQPSRPQRFPSRTSAPLPTVVTTWTPSPIVVSTGATTAPISSNVLSPSRNPENQPARRSPSPTPAARRQGGSTSVGKEKNSQPVTGVMQEPQQATAERNNESEEDSEYEDAEDGILPSNGDTQTQAQTDFECRICGESVASKFCKDCKDTFCVPCNDVYHKHRDRQSHVRTDLVTPTAYASTELPVVAGTTAPAVGTAVAGASGVAAGAASGVRLQTQKVTSSAVTVANSCEVISQRSRPVPAPRRNKTPLPSYQGTAQGAKAPEPKMEEQPPPLPPRVPYGTTQRQQTTPTPIHQPASPRSPGISQVTSPTSPPVMTSATIMLPPSVLGNQSVVSHPVVSTVSSQAQSQGREIRRPPPFISTSNTATKQSSQGDQVDNKLVVKSPPPLPPKQSRTAVPKVPVESKTTSQASSSTEKSPASALSCPNCYCLNSGDAKKCLFCNKPLPVKTQHEPSNQLVSTRQNEVLETRNFPAPVWALAADQQEAASRMRQQSQGNVNVMASSGAGHAIVDSDRWECEHCTYHNPRTRRICEMCCKTSRTSPAEPGALQAATSREARPIASSQNLTNMAMHINSQQVQTVTSQTKKTDPQNVQVASTGTPTRAAEPTFPAQGYQQPGMFGGSVGVTQPNQSEPFLSRTFSGMGQGGILNSSGMVNPEAPVRSSFSGVSGYSQGGVVTSGSQFTRDAGLPYVPQGFPPPPMEIPGVGSLPFLQHHVSPGFPQAPPFTAWSGPDEDVRRQQEDIYIYGSKYVEWLKKAEKEGFTAEEVNIASVLGIDDPQGPIHWLHTAWYDLIHKVMIELAIPENSQEIGNVSPEEVREALIECTGEVTRATAKCKEIRKKKVKELQQAGVYAETDCISALDSSQGDTVKAILTLEKMAMQPMLQRVLNSCLPDHATQEEIFMALTRQANTQSPQDKANFEAIVKDRGQNLDRRIRAILAEKNIVSWGRAETAIKLIDMDFSVELSVEAACSCGDLRSSLRYLRQECPICTEDKPMSQMITFLHCQDRVCQECVSQYITVTIKDKNIMHLVCPCCGKPENLEDEAVATEYFNNFDIMIRGLVDQETHDLFQRKLRDRTLMKEPNFRWCSHCSSGFINEQPRQIKMACPHCHRYTCFKCKRQWEDQHEGITCEQFAAWKEANDPEYQAAGLAAHLKMNGIVCPGCKFRYDLSKGGCMHFKCAMCPHEFCSGCYNPFLNNNPQNRCVSEHCTVRGLHAHHPRDCYFYLRDRSPEELQKLLRDNNVEYNTEPPEGQGNASDDEAPGAAAPLLCKVSEQKETENGLVDGECGAEVPAGHAGLCRKHYVEYLVVLVNDNLLDPADIMLSDDLKRVLERGYVDPPVKPNRMNDQQYKQLLLQAVKDQLPLPPKSPRKRVLDDEEEEEQEEEEEVLIVQNNNFDDDDDDNSDDDFDDDDVIDGPLAEPEFEVEV